MCNKNSPSHCKLRLNRRQNTSTERIFRIENKTNQELPTFLFWFSGCFNCVFTSMLHFRNNLPVLIRGYKSCDWQSFQSERNRPKKRKRGVSFPYCLQQLCVDKRLVSRATGPKDAVGVQTKKEQKCFLLHRWKLIPNMSKSALISLFMWTFSCSMLFWESRTSLFSLFLFIVYFWESI